MISAIISSALTIVPVINNESAPKVKIETITPPPLRQVTLRDALSQRDENSALVLNHFKSACSAFIDRYPPTYQSASFNALKIISQWPASRTLTHEDAAAMTHTLNLMNHLSENDYTDTAAWEYLSWSLNLTLSQLNGRSIALETKVDNLFKNISNAENYRIEKRDSLGHSPSYLIFLNGSVAPYAILKESNAEFFSSFQKLIPEFCSSSPVWEHELISFEEDQLLGLNHTPTTVAVSFTHEGKTVNGVVQEYIKDVRPAGSSTYFVQGGARLIHTLPKSNAHLVALSGMIKGLSAGHMNNYVFHFNQDEQGVESIDEAFEIDQEELLLPYNRLNEKVKVLRIEELKLEMEKAKPEDKEKLQKQIAMVTKSIILCRLWILGLPQNEQPCDAAALMNLQHPSLIPLLKLYHEKVAKRYYRLEPEALQAQIERVEKLQFLAAAALETPGSRITTRDMYFEIFGGKELFELARKRRYPTILAFNNCVSDPYQAVIKDFADPEGTVAECKRLDAPVENSPDYINLFHNLRQLEGLEAF